MKVVFKKDPTKKYVCTICGKQFNWDKESGWYGKYDEKPEAILCSNYCKQQFKQLKINKL